MNISVSGSRIQVMQFEQPLIFYFKTVHQQMPVFWSFCTHLSICIPRSGHLFLVLITFKCFYLNEKGCPWTSYLSKVLVGKMSGPYCRQIRFSNSWDTSYHVLVLSDFTFPKSVNKTNYIPLFVPVPPKICQITFWKYKICLPVSPQASTRSLSQ